MTLRGQLTTVALLGTAQQTFEVPPGETPLDRLLAKLQPREMPGRFLDSAALVVLYEVAGARPGKALPPPAPCRPDPRPPCSAAAASHLAAILADQRHLLPEWLSLAAQAGQRP